MKNFPENLISDVWPEMAEDEIKEFSDQFSKNLDKILKTFPDFFSDRDIEILNLYYRQNLETKTIAKQLKISQYTVRRHVAKCVYNLRNPHINKLFRNSYCGNVISKLTQSKEPLLEENRKYYLDNINKVTAEMSHEEIDELIKTLYVKDYYSLTRLGLPVRLTCMLYRHGYMNVKLLIDDIAAEKFEIPDIDKKDYDMILESVKNFQKFSK